MASDEMINEIWKIAQENSKDPINKEEFGKDLRKSVFSELERATDGVVLDINDEFARALPIILHQAKVNPDLIYENNGKGFSVAIGILSKAVLTVKYENRYIPGTAEYKKEFPKESLPEIAFTAVIADSLINNFENLSMEERELLSQNWDKLNGIQIGRIMDGLKEKVKNDPNLSEENKKDVLSNITDFSDENAFYTYVEHLPISERKKVISEYLKKRCEMDPEFKKRYTSYTKIEKYDDIRIFNLIVKEFRSTGLELYDLQNQLDKGQITYDEYLKKNRDYGAATNTKEIINEVLNKIDKDDISVIIGNENNQMLLKDYSLISLDFTATDTTSATLGIVSPKRVDYKKAVSTLKAVNDRLKKIFGKEKEDKDGARKED